MTETFGALDAVELAVVERSGFVESRHVGSAVVLDPSGSPVLALGPREAPVLPRSSLKPVQAAVAVAAGAPLTGVQLALATASHAGTPRHIEVVRSMLAGSGLSESDLGCPPSWPLDSRARDDVAQAGGTPSPLLMNCSGKHAAMLAACVAQGWPTAGYLAPDHPMQVAIREAIEGLTGHAVTATAVDGCGAAIFGVSLEDLAHLVQWCAQAGAGSSEPLESAAARVMAAVQADPWAIDGEGRANTTVIAGLATFAKGGAEGVLVAVAPSGTAVALKVLDGAARAATAVALELLVRAGALVRDDVEPVLAGLALDVLGGGRPVGRIRVTAGA